MGLVWWMAWLIASTHAPIVEKAPPPRAALEAVRAERVIAAHQREARRLAHAGALASRARSVDI